MRIVQHAAIRPNRCAVIPFMGNSNASGFIDTGMDLDLEHVYVSFEAVCEMATMLGWSGPSVVKDKDQQIASLQARADQLEAELKEADSFASAIDVIESRDFRARKKAGRKPSTKEEVA